MKIIVTFIVNIRKDTIVNYAYPKGMGVSCANIMKALLFIFAIFLSGCAVRLPNSRIADSPVIKFVDDNMGKRVGGGLCYELAKGAMVSKSGDKAWWTHNYKWNVLFRHRVRAKNVSVGDLMSFTNVEMSDGVTAQSHIAIVYRVISKGVFIIAEQNYICNACNTLKESRVVLTKIDINNLVRGKIKFYHFR